MHLQKPADALLLLTHRVKHSIAGLQNSRVNPEKCQVTDKRVGGDLERERRKRLLVTLPVVRPRAHLRC